MVSPLSTIGRPRASVIIPHFNMPGPLETCLASVTTQQLAGDFEVIVVDNGSRVTPDRVLAAYPEVRSLSEAAPGPGPARNAGVKAARASILVFIDADCWAETGWLSAAVTAVEAQGNRGVVGGDVQIGFVDPNNLSGVEAYEAVFAYRQRMYIEKLGFSGTGNLAMHRDVYDAVGPFAGIDIAEDMDWGRRATAAGFAPCWAPGMRIYHPARPDLASLRVKWQRHIAHAWTEHRKSGRPLWAWVAKAIALPASTPVDALKLLLAPRLGGLRNRLRGLSILAQVRLMRGTEMLRVIRAADETAATHWHADPT